MFFVSNFISHKYYVNFEILSPLKAWSEIVDY